MFRRGSLDRQGLGSGSIKPIQTGSFQGSNSCGLRPSALSADSSALLPHTGRGCASVLNTHCTGQHTGGSCEREGQTPCSRTTQACCLVWPVDANKAGIFRTERTSETGSCLSASSPLKLRGGVGKAESTVKTNVCRCRRQFWGVDNVPGGALWVSHKQMTKTSRGTHVVSQPRVEYPGSSGRRPGARRINPTPTAALVSINTIISGNHCCPTTVANSISPRGRSIIKLLPKTM
eukprot:365305-Chlamydomonas_euryale.AAC.10